MGNSNSVAPSRKAVDLYLDGSDWKLALFSADGATQIASTTIGEITIGVSSVIDISNGLDLRALGGAPAHELRIFGADEIQIQHAEALHPDFNVSTLTVSDGEVLGQQVEKIISIGAGITRVRIAWG